MMQQSRNEIWHQKALNISSCPRAYLTPCFIRMKTLLFKPGNITDIEYTNNNTNMTNKSSMIVSHVFYNLRFVKTHYIIVF